MRRLTILVLLAACGGGARPAGPAWPESAGTVAPESSEDDGGESLEPARSDDAAALEHSEDAQQREREGDDQFETP